MRFAIEATPHRRGRSLTDLRGAVPIPEYMRVTTANSSAGKRGSR
jgi:hypothetical protein